ncbi:MAG: helix-turn-helix domain-containing protein, partial [Bacteroidales bacterium]|nr:helix-turn-helix domain-containing protein [Bacteroidales bacterium]
MMESLRNGIFTLFHYKTLINNAADYKVFKSTKPMMEALIHINIAQALFTAFITLTKRPLNIIDKILSAWLIIVSLLFAWNLVRLQIPGDLINSWMFRAVIILAFPSFLFLYIKYLTLGTNKFYKKDLWHFAFFGIFFTTTLVLTIIHPLYADTSNFILSFKIFPMLFGLVFVLTFVLYGFHSFKLIKQFINERDEYFSFHSGKVSIDWVRKLVYIFYVFFGVLIFVGIAIQFTPEPIDLSVYFTGCTTLFLYTISFYGYKQTKLPIMPKVEKTAGNSYKKSGLKEKDAKQYEKSILYLMEKEKPWLNPEIAVNDISTELNIPQHYITQVLNEGLKKNFYTLINEYRTKEVIRLFQEEKYEKWGLTSIAFEAGFNSKSSFNSFFKKYTGKTPS